MARKKVEDRAILLTGPEAADLCRVSLSTWYVWKGEKRIPASVKVGKTVRWRRAELEAWADAGCPPLSHWESRKRAGKAA